MSFNLLESNVSASNHNGRGYAATGQRGRELSPHEVMALTMLVQAVQEVKLLCRYGLITRDGKFKPWPKLVVRPGCCMRELRNIDGMSGPNDHVLLCKFFNHPDHAQHWMDLLNLNSPPATELWAMLLAEHGAAQ